MQKITDKEMFLALVQSPLSVPMAVRQSSLGGGMDINAAGLMKAARAIAADWNTEVERIQRESQERANTLGRKEGLL